MKNTVPSDEEISALESKLAEMRKSKDEARIAAMKQLRAAIDAVGEVIPPSEAAPLLRIFEKKVSFGRKNPRGTRVPDDVKERLIHVLKTENKTLSELEKMFNLSISYIAKIKNQVGLTKPRQPEPAESGAAG